MSGVTSCTPNVRYAMPRTSVHSNDEDDDEKWKGVQLQRPAFAKFLATAMWM